eukprot:TRINITY_DN786_c0_g1_i1.p1 TRINITY_DN786_c0_g1~~TRINITY_DN786_c0_g1_i1.p1  ORF type:complete len:273 (-),score=35.89 TRINITY_DN786_c0_g1_i1:227-1045(-)
MRALLLLLFVAVALADDYAQDNSDYVRVPGGLWLHKFCIHEVTQVPNEPARKCQYPARFPAQNEQIYSMDANLISTDNMKDMTTDWIVPALPAKRGGGQILFFWPGFKSTEPKMGLPVLQPVLQYGSNGYGGGDFWCVRSWFVYGDAGEAYVSAELKLQVGDYVSSYMHYDDNAKMWTIFANNTRTGQTTVLTETRAKTHNIDFKVAMLVLETIMPSSNYCPLYPSAPNQITWSKVTVNGASPHWTDRVTKTECGQKITETHPGETVFSWHN